MCFVFFMESNFSEMVNGYEYYDVSFLPNHVPDLVGFGVPLSSEFDLRLDHHHHQQPSTWVPATQQDQDLDHLLYHDQYSPPPTADEIDSENNLLKYVNQLLMEEETLAESQSMSYDSLMALRKTEEMLQKVITDSKAQSPYITPPDSITSSTSSGSSTGEYLNSNRIETEAISTEREALDSRVMLFQGPNMSRGEPASEILVRSMFSDADSVNQFKRGVEEASKFLPNTDQWIFNLDHEVVSVKDEKGLRVRKHHREREEEEEARSFKQSAVNVDDGIITEMFDKVLLLDNQNEPQIKEEEEEEADNVSSKTSSNTKEGGRGKKKSKAVDFRTLLTLCAQSISSGDKLAADELLKQIKKQCSPLGDASQRLAYFFAKALEARLQGSSGGMIQSYYDSITSKKRTAAQILKTYKTFLSASPFMTLIYFFSNKMILDASRDVPVLHIIDFGILYGFQWPMFIQYISKRKVGPRKLRITGVELPQNGHRPTEKIEDTGRRLREYCKRFGVPFEYNAIASKNWETIRIEEFKIRPNEVLAVNSMLRFKNLRDVTPGEEDCPRDRFFKLIRDLKPDVFLSSTINGSFNAPFFATRFKEALFHYSSLFDMFGSTLSKDNPERMHFEGEFFGREVMNVIACEGVDRVERPETYKQWQVRMMRAGFKQKYVKPELVEFFREKMKKWGYHKDFVLDQDSNWFLQGWKGRILFSSSCWVPS
ncbi:unnamed protein product [Eruca vesicaria subsp. sativa]|uniref:Uncharacterized protein n=1 Tax=Eruca vesicaria subsp. sativa TaxID=29727 RepID=A0ABC8LK94_ERUVS|nr:unnamed protein product [Eruca vesicaria subsp. sativa]